MTAITSGATGNWSAGGTWTGGAVPVEGDTVTIQSGHTIKVDQDITIGADTSTAAINIAAGGKLEYLDSAAAVYTIILKGDLTVAGTYESGTSGTRISATKGIILKTNYSASLADGKYGIFGSAGGTFRSKGNVLTYDRCLLAANAAAAATTMTSSVTTGWKSGDALYIAPTNRTAAEYESRSLTVDASGTTLTVSALTYAHSGTSPTQAEIINVTRNNKITSHTTTSVGFVQFLTTCTVDVDWTEFSYLGTNTAAKYGVYITTTTGSCTIDRCSFHDTKAYSIYSTPTLSSSGTVVITNCVFGKAGGLAFTNAALFTHGSTTAFTQTYTVSGHVMIGSISNGYGISHTSANGSAFTFSDLTVTGCGIGISFGSVLNVNMVSPGTFATFVAHTNSSAGINSSAAGATITGITAWRNQAAGINIVSVGCTYTTGLLFGNTTNNISMSTSASNRIVDYVCAGDSTYGTNYGVILSTSIGFYDAVFDNCTFGVASGIRIAHSTADLNMSSGAIAVCRIVFHDCLLSSGTEFAGDLNASWVSADSYFAVHNKDAVDGTHVTYRKGGKIERETTVYKTASPSVKGTPSSASYALMIDIKRIDVLSGASATVSVDVRKTSAYAGAAPKLYVRRNYAAGITSDTLLDTFSAAADTWETLTGTTATVTENTVLEVYVICDGTAGSVYVDDWSV